jgi:hypothetical protein
LSSRAEEGGARQSENGKHKSAQPTPISEKGEFKGNCKWIRNPLCNGIEQEFDIIHKMF